MGAMDKELEGLRARAEEATQLGKQLEEATTETERIQGLYQSEQARGQYELPSHTKATKN